MLKFRRRILPSYLRAFVRRYLRIFYIYIPSYCTSRIISLQSPGSTGSQRISGRERARKESVRVSAASQLTRCRRHFGVPIWRAAFSNLHPQNNCRTVHQEYCVMSGNDNPKFDVASAATFDALERASQLASAPEINRAVLQHSKSHPRMLESKTP